MHSRLTSRFRRGSIPDVERIQFEQPINTKMNHLKYFSLAVIAIALAGCATKTITSGREFDVTKIASIQKGTTTSEELIRLLGPPFTATQQPAGVVIWDYTWKKGKATTRQSSDGPVVTSSGERKTLEVLIMNGVVQNYTYTDDPFWNEQLKISQ